MFQKVTISKLLLGKDWYFQTGEGGGARFWGKNEQKCKGKFVHPSSYLKWTQTLFSEKGEGRLLGKIYTLIKL